MALHTTLSLKTHASVLPVQANEDSLHLLRAVELAEYSSGLVAPHPNFGCVIARGPRIVGEGALYAQGTKSAELQAVEFAGEHARGATAYLNLEPGDCHGDDSAINALTQAGVSRVVVGMRHPLTHFRGKAITALRQNIPTVDVGGEDFYGEGAIAASLKACQVANAPILYRAAHHLPYSTLKYAMTLDGKIATSSGHAAWVSSAESRQRVFKTRAESDAIVVGGNTVRRDNPSLTTRQEGGHQPARIVMSRCLNLPEEANLWDVSTTQTIIMTQSGARKDFQKILAAKGVEIVEFEFLTPKVVMEYCYSRGYLSVMWECGGTLSAPAIQGGVIHKVLAFIAPKIVGGLMAPTPVGELGMVQMTQALKLSDVVFEQTGPDMLVTGFLQPLPDLTCHSPPEAVGTSAQAAKVGPPKSPVIFFSRPWDLYGAFSNFSPHPITLPDSVGNIVVWNSVEQYYQAQKFVGVTDKLAIHCEAQIRQAKSPEEAKQLGRTLAKKHPNLVRPNWENVKKEVMLAAIRAKFEAYSTLRSLLLSTEGSFLVESSQSDLFWDVTRDGVGLNQLGHILMDLREEFLKVPSSSVPNGHTNLFHSWNRHRIKPQL